MAEEPRKDVPDVTWAELRARASELEITGRSSMSKAELHEAVADAESQLGVDEPERAPDGEKPASEITAPSIGPHTVIEKKPPEERLAKHEQSEVDAMGLDKRREVVGQKYGASFAKQATVYGVALAVLVALVIGGKLAVDELDKGPEVNADEAPWSDAQARQQPPTDLDFPRGVTP